jgi:hypothetical protein
LEGVTTFEDEVFNCDAVGVGDARELFVVGDVDDVVVMELVSEGAIAVAFGGVRGDESVG